jgi:uncharacterized membrane protein
VMIIMALDHVRDFFHAGAMVFQPEDLARTSAALFFTRWITHICAPVFMFTAGISAFLWLRSRGAPEQLSRYHWTRGLWLVFLDLVVLRLAMFFSLTSGIVILNVLWALGWSMVALAFLSRLPVRLLAVLSISVIVLHNLTDGISASHLGRAGWLWNIAHQPGVLNVQGVPVLVAYPLIPWIFVMACGFCFGHVMMLDSRSRSRWLIRAGVMVTVGFLVLRWLNIYGDPRPWSTELPGTAVLSFLRTNKYPPSLSFLLMTLGPALLLLAAFDRIRFKYSNPLLVFGRVPLFFFILHMFVIHLLSVPLALVRYGHAGFLWNPLPTLGGNPALYPAGYGYDLPVVYVLWVLIVAALYPVCLWFWTRKKQSTSPWFRLL